MDDRVDMRERMIDARFFLEDDDDDGGDGGVVLR